MTNLSILQNMPVKSKGKAVRFKSIVEWKYFNLLVILDLASGLLLAKVILLEDHDNCERFHQAKD